MTRPPGRTWYAVFRGLGELQLYLNLNTSGKLQGHQGLDALLVGVENIDQSLVGAALELLTAVLVLVHCTKNGNDFALGRQRDRARNLSVGTLCSFYDLLRCLIDQRVVISFQSDSDFLCVSHCVFSSSNTTL